MRLLVAGLAVGFSVIPFLIAGAPVESQLGVMQKIFYFHVPCAWLLLGSTGAAAAGSLLFLFRGSTRGDRLALASVELGVLFGACTLVTGSLYARVAWGVFWTWDARLTSSLLLWLMLVAYLLARRYGGPGASRLAAALALFAAADAPLVYVSVNVWRTIHPTTTVIPTLEPLMARVFWASTVMFCGLWGVLAVLRVRLERARAALEALEATGPDPAHPPRPG
ncbi:MAG TPA: cytochrome c biogenesis protein CcsA [Polyangia bacterium]|nr:cytochrome c biogenesis protein CcsA [Polyangia bacterium]